MTPNCPICNTNLYVHQIPDCSTHAVGWESDKTKMTCYYSDIFECKLCKGEIHYSEEQLNNEPMFINISYRKQNYIPNVRKCVRNEYEKSNNND